MCPNVKLCHVKVGLNISLIHSSSLLYLVIIGHNSFEKLTIYEIMSSYYLVQFGLIYPQNTMFVHI